MNPSPTLLNRGTTNDQFYKEKQVKSQQSSRLEFVKKYLVNNLALLDAEKNTSVEQRRYSRFSFLRTLFASFKNAFAMITSLSEFHFRFRRFILLVQTKKSNFYGPWQQHKWLKTIEIRKAWPDIFDGGYIRQFQPGTTHKIQQQQKRQV